MQPYVWQWGASFQKKTCITGELGEGDLFRELTLSALSQNLDRPRYGFYPIVKFSDLVALSAKSLMAYKNSPYKKYVENSFFKIGTWNSPKGDWMISLAVPLPAKNPFSPSQAPSLKLVISYVFPENLDDIEVNINNVFFSIGQMGEVGQHTLQPIPTAFQTDCFKFTREVNVQVHTIPEFEVYLYRFIDPSSTYRFNLDMFYSVHTQKVIVPDYIIPDAFFDFTIIDCLCQYLSLRDISNLRATNKNFSEAFSSCAIRRLRSLISKWFSDVPGFVTALRISGGVLSGSAILSVLCPGNWEPNDLDFVVPSASQHALASFLTEEGYAMTIIPAPNSHYPPIPNFELKRFTKKNSNGKVLSIDVSILQEVFPSGRRPVDFIRTYHSTVVMNFYDGYSLYCLYPSLTFNGKFYRNSLSPNARAPRCARALSKYINRGFRKIPLPYPYISQLPPPVDIWYQEINFQQ